ncbi:hypothetical protein KLP40_18820 [Hymenobacter sp. NST-14]|uniref:DUF5712 family protein n=1 Tax=Hymenobacter piscis TaxID=2839984 RepID=UPI001C025D9F|nr:DUF5712 family protein [Hymenobacter piscis]MBT9395229.1 hypothetical protein [Hymenobacter piscis]
MYAKVLNPATHGRKVYANNGSARRATNYLEKEARESGKPGAEFFGTEGAGKLSADQVVEMFDNNHKGLGKDAVKFHSLVLSPSQEELALLGNDPQKLEQFTRTAMQLYAANFNLKGGRELGEKDLVWAATIHTERKNRGDDEGPQGELKPGYQTHVHVLVSARDREQKITLNPLGAADRFNRVSFQSAVHVEMDLAVGRVNLGAEKGAAGRRQRLEYKRGADIQARARERPKKELTPEQVQKKLDRLDGQVARLNSKLPAAAQLDPEQVKDAARERKFDNVFYNRLGKIERNAEKGNLTREPIEYLRTGRVQPGPQLDNWQPASAPPDMSARLQRVLNKEPSRAATSAIPSIERRINQLAAALKPASRSQDMRSEEEKIRELNKGQEFEL